MGVRQLPWMALLLAWPTGAPAASDRLPIVMKLVGMR